MDLIKESMLCTRDMIEIGRKTCLVGGERVIYSLYRTAPDSDSFRLAVASQNERAEGMLCGTLAEASELFERVANGLVPPYILQEILEDFEKAKM